LAQSQPLRDGLAMINAEPDDPFVVGLKVLMVQTGEKPAPLAKSAGMGVSAIRDLFRKGSSPKVSTAMAVAEALGTTIDGVVAAGRGLTVALLHNNESDSSKELVPVYDVAASAGHGSVVDYESIACKLAFPPDYLHHITSTNPKHLQIISVKGDSMNPTLHHDDLVMLDRSKTSLNYDGLFVLRYGEALLVKRVSRSATPGRIIIISDNRSIYPPQEYDGEDVAVIGKVIWYGRKV
jgi:phage repressor protein C with HTH and peptisase S24 domain